MSVLLQLLPITVTHSFKGSLTVMLTGAVSSCCCPPLTAAVLGMLDLEQDWATAQVWHRRGCLKWGRPHLLSLHLAPPLFALSSVTSLSFHSPHQGPS